VELRGFEPLTSSMPWATATREIPAQVLPTSVNVHLGPAPVAVVVTPLVTPQTDTVPPPTGSGVFNPSLPNRGLRTSLAVNGARLERPRLVHCGMFGLPVVTRAVSDSRE
jgi:hypothetical protein